MASAEIELAETGSAEIGSAETGIVVGGAENFMQMISIIEMEQHFDSVMVDYNALAFDSVDCSFDLTFADRMGVHFMGSINDCIQLIDH